MNFDFLNFLFGCGDDAATVGGTMDAPMTVINPSTGLPMMDSGMGGVDVGGSPFGMDLHSSMSDSFTGDIG
jgi:hypothetical protein